MRRSHPVFDGAIGMFHQFFALSHRLRVLFKLGRCRFQYMFLFPALDAALFACRALRPQRAGGAVPGPVDVELLALFFSGKAVPHPLPDRTHVFILPGIVDKVRARVLTFGALA